MMRRKFYSILGVFLLSFMVCSTSFALDTPDGVTYDPAMSQMALTMAMQQFGAARAQLLQMAETATPDQKVMIEELIAKLEEDKIQKIDSIKIYFADENIEGEAYDRVLAYYRNEISGMRDIDPEDALKKLPAGTMIPPATQTRLESLMEAGKVKAAYGTSGKSRVSVLTVYLDPLNNFELLEGTVIVIATEK